MDDKKYASLNTLSQFLDNIKPNLIPSGAIILWSGTIDNIPEGWHLCDGTNGTPDLRNRFVLGADGEDYEVGDTGGEKEHTLTIDEMPSHSHKFTIINAQLPSGAAYSRFSGSGNAVGGLIDYTGGDQPHNNMPPYYALCYIMKLQM